MYLAYSFLLTLGLIVLIPHFLLKAIIHGKYVEGLWERLGSLPRAKFSHNHIIWLHCVSVGETQAARPLVQRLKAEFPQSALVVSTITNTGQKVARNVFQSQASSVFYFPFDWRWSVRRALKKIQPDVVLIMETELWPNFLRECKARQIPVVLVNGRISRQSFRRYRLIRFFLQRVLSDLNLAVMQSDADANRIAELGLAKDKLFTAGNLKFDVAALPTKAGLTESLQNRFGIQKEIPLILAASTHAPEENIVLQSFQQIRQRKKARLMIAPRHPERFGEVARLLDESGLNWVRRTSPPNPADVDADVILLDTIGELPSMYSLATIVFVGGSIVDRGGHNVLEPAAAGTCVVTGHQTHNFQAIVQLLNEAHAIIQLPPLDPTRAAHSLTRELERLIADPALREELVQRASAIIECNRGAADRTLELIRSLSGIPVRNDLPQQTVTSHS